MRYQSAAGLVNSDQLQHRPLQSLLGRSQVFPNDGTDYAIGLDLVSKALLPITSLEDGDTTRLLDMRRQELSRHAPSPHPVHSTIDGLEFF